MIEFNRIRKSHIDKENKDQIQTVMQKDRKSVV